MTVTSVGEADGGTLLTVALGLARTAGSGRYVREPTGWTDQDLTKPLGEPKTPAVVVTDGGDTLIARGLVTPDDAFVVDVVRAGETSWTRLPVGLNGLTDRPDLTAIPWGPTLGLCGGGLSVFLVAPIEGRDVLGVWEIAGLLTGTPSITRIDQDSGRMPASRTQPSVVRHAGRVYVHGGVDDDGPVWGLWSVPEAGGTWTPARVRNRQRRVGGVLLSNGPNLVLLGGASVPGGLHREVVQVDLTAARPTWRELPALPLEDGPGVLCARNTPSGLEALVWADRTRPVRATLAPSDLAWTLDVEEHDAPNPPADGEAVWVEDALHVVGAPPLPPSQVLFRVGGYGHVAFLPAIDVSGPEVVRFDVLADGSTDRAWAPGEQERPNARVGAGRERPTGSRTAPARRLGAPGRLSYGPFRLRQRSLGPWASPLVLDLDGIVGLDPRLGRVLVGSDVGSGVFTASYRRGRGAELGPGLQAPQRAPGPAWSEPDLEPAPVPPDLAPGGPAITWVDPPREGRNGVRATLDSATGDDAQHLLGIRGSPLLPAARLVASQDGIVGVHAADPGGQPHILAEDGVSLTLQERLPDDLDSDAEGASWFLAGLITQGTIEVHAAQGTVDVRWCDVGLGGMGLRVAGAGHQTRLLRRTLPDVSVVVRLVGCHIGTLEVPPWVQVIAAGCTFDAGDRAAVALAAAGARVRLRACTVVGRTQAGLLEASSCAFAGTVSVDRTDLGFARYCALAPGGRLPLTYRSRTQVVSLKSVDPLSPVYLVLDDNNGPDLLAVGEGGRIPGAHGERTQQLRELHARTQDHLPMGLVPHHRDRTTADLVRMRRRTT